MTTSDIGFEGYFDFIGEDDIRIKGTRVGIETVLDDYINAFSPEEIAVRYPALSLEQVYATITYYLHNREEVESYLRRWREHTDAFLAKQNADPSGAISRIREIKMQRLSQL